MMRLIQLPNGNWVSRKLIINIKAIQGRRGYKETHELDTPDKVSVRYGSTPADYETINCNSYKEAQEMRDDIANRVNPK